MIRPRDDARAIFDAAVAAVNAAALVERYVRSNSEMLAAIERARRIVVIGGGKAAAAMVAGLETALANQLDLVSGLVNVPDALIRPTRCVRLVPARPPGCNEPTALAVAATEEMLNLVASLTSDDFVICVLSGGGSALLSAPVAGVTLQDKIETTRLLTSRGATIADLNCVRKHLSRVKGGQLAAASRAGSIWSLILSDVQDDRLDVVASGPAAPDPTTYSDAMRIVERLQLRSDVPTSVVAHLARGANGEIQETPKQVANCVHNVVVGNNETALAGAYAEAERRGYRVVRLPPAFSNTESAASELAEAVQREPVACSVPICILRGGETTVRLPADHGLGGRNQQLALEVGLAVNGDATILCASTDGEDGPTDAGGAIFDRKVVEAAKALQLNGKAYRDRHDAYHFFEKADGLLKTGLTGTNVMDIHLTLILTKSRQ